MSRSPFPGLAVAFIVLIAGLIVAFTIGFIFTRSWKWAVFWAVLVGPALVLQSAHTITDVIGGALLGLILVVAMLSFIRTESLVER